MPEGPEVSKMVDKLQKFNGSCLTKILLVSGRYSRHGLPKGWDNFNDKVLPDKIVKIGNQGKMIWIEMASGNYIKIVPAMSGNLSAEPDKHLRWEFILKGKDGNIYFNDMRNFGSIHFLTEAEFDKVMAKLGPSPIKAKKLDYDALIEKARRSDKKPIAELLLNQGFLAGVGNYIRSDALYLSKIAPTRKVSSITDRELKELIKNIVKISKKSYKEKRYKFLVYRIGPDREVIKGRSVWWNSKVQS